MMRKHTIIPPAALLLSFVLLALGCGETPALQTQTAPESSTGFPAAPPTPSRTAAPVRLICAEDPIPPAPDEFQPVYDFLETRLQEKFRRLPAAGDHPEHETFIGAELSVANGNRGEALLQPSALPAVRLYLDRLQAAGATGVTIQISDPLLTALDVDSLAYLEFFRQAVDEAHARNMRVLVETGPVFPDPEFSNVTVDWSQIHAEEYFEKRKLQLVVIAREVKPDYLSLGNEPGTEQRLTGLDFTPEEYRQFLARTVAEIGSPPDMLLGGGTGSWEDPAFRDAFLQTEGLQFLNIHVYPIVTPQLDLLEVVRENADLAKAAGRKVIIGEAWLYKATPDELEAGISYQEVYMRDVYSFWQPLDILFLRTMIRLARAEEFEYLSFFWSGYFFGYLEYDRATAGLSSAELVRNLNRAQLQNLQAGQATATGCAFRDEIQSPDPRELRPT
jgi:hypothetical protein